MCHRGSPHSNYAAPGERDREPILNWSSPTLRSNGSDPLWVDFCVRILFCRSAVDPTHLNVQKWVARSCTGMWSPLGPQCYLCYGPVFYGTSIYVLHLFLIQGCYQQGGPCQAFGSQLLPESQMIFLCDTVVVLFLQQVLMFFNLNTDKYTIM